MEWARVIRATVANLGKMGRSHALAWHRDPAFELVGSADRFKPVLDAALAEYAVTLIFIRPFVAWSWALFVLQPIPTAIVFVKKPLATNLTDAWRVAWAVARLGRKVVVRFILRHHPGWRRLFGEARRLGGPDVFRPNLNQQRKGLHERFTRR